MSTALTAPAVQVCAFMLGCALIHAGRAHAAILTRLLVPAALIAAVLLLLAASLDCAPEEPGALDAVEIDGVP